MLGLNRSFKNALRGICIALKEERNLKIHLLITFLVLILAYYFNIEKLDFIIILTMIVIVISLELMNTAIERTMDLINPSSNEQVGKIKDIAAGSVLITALVAAVVGFIIFIPYIYESLSRWVK